MTSPSDSKVPSPNPQVEPASNSSNGTSLSMASPSERRKHWTAMCAVLHIPVSAMQVEQAEMLERMVLADPAANDDDKSMVQEFVARNRLVYQGIAGKGGDPGLVALYAQFAAHFGHDLPPLRRCDYNGATNVMDMMAVQNIRTLNAANYQLGMDIKAIINRLSPLPPGFPTQFNIKKLSKLPLNLLRMYFVYLQFYLRPLRISHHDLEPIFRGSKGPLVRALRALLGVPPTGVSPFH
ncbi:hypothetical protein CcaverHIS002_0105750 [Cutaneotrichosporon cavernicola]|uniref:Uncharacterized protein n=1 Tax=Cutaneotrichosporon cavernicola TaxID=279322 RepID=A0AA48I1U7_9TREE|nr:uncharacterized protein CcaverHIS019_0105700 [Cutaneotrichosporon cavernicola]BEI80046.1 hypothetical protein CcaverHIS002_0105750 [Cutaneotrichosporon cavernicola]BEI87852.1 hypothetical protein CcaverHIS019_0105700 [Cutaneotrichosporon cavernicola]BEI95626.1 hypothetical protein CcaverHIS631_0105750 [Cutaneotrichosporon cavernicola]